MEGSKCLCYAQECIVRNIALALFARRNDKIYIHRGAHLVRHPCRYMQVIPTLKSFCMEAWWGSKARTLRRRKQSPIL